MSLTVKSGIAEVETYVDGNLDKVKNIEEEAQEKYPTFQAREFNNMAHAGYLDDFACYTESITYKQENLKEKALALCGT
ncbi:MAG: hypothetical protein ACI4N6_01955 [Eubacteriales bacterium]